MLQGLFETFVDEPFAVELGLELFGNGLTKAEFVGFPVLVPPVTEPLVTDVDTLVGFPVLATELFETDVEMLTWFPVDTNSAAFDFSAAGEVPAGELAGELAAELREVTDVLVGETAVMLVDFMLVELGGLASVVEVGEADEDGEVVDNLIGITLSVIIWIEVEDDVLDILGELDVLDVLDVLDLDELEDDIDDELEIISLRW